MTQRRPQTRQEFIDYCLRKLGNPVIDINVTPSQIDDRVNEALSLFYTWHYNGTELKHIIMLVTDEMVTNGYITVPAEVDEVVDAKVGNSSNALTGDVLSDVTYNILLSDYLNTGAGSFQLQFDIANYQLIQYQISNMNFVLRPLNQWSFNKITRRLYLQGVNLDHLRSDGSVLFFLCNTKYLDSNQEFGNDSSTVWSDYWLQQYTIALIEQQWGANLSKFAGTPLPGGITVNGVEIYDRATAKIEKLEDELRNLYSTPVDFFLM